MKKRLRKNNKSFNFYEYHVKHGFKSYESIFALLTPSRYSAWELLGYTEEDRTFLFQHKKNKTYRYLDEIAIYKYIPIIRIDDILNNDLCLRLKNEPTKGEIRYV